MSKKEKERIKKENQQHKTICGHCGLQVSKGLLNGRWCSVECETAHKDKCDQCGQVNDSEDNSVFCKACKQAIVIRNNKILWDKTIIPTIPDRLKNQKPRKGKVVPSLTDLWKKWSKSPNFGCKHA